MNPVTGKISTGLAPGLVPADKISLGHMALFLLFLPFDMICSELVLISFLLHTLINLNRSAARSVFQQQTGWLCGLFILNVLCLLWSPDKKEGINYVLRQLALFLFPVILAPLAVLIKEQRKKLLHVLGFTCVITLLYLYADAARVIYYYGMPLRSLLSQAFINHNFTAPIGLHATYMSVYVALAAVSFTLFLLQEPDPKRRVLYVCCLFILFAGLVQLSSRSVLVSFWVTLILILPFFLERGKKRRYYLLFIVFLSAVTVAVISRAGSLKKRYVAELKNDLTQESINNEMIESRVTRWKAAWPLVKQAPLTGHGTGSEKKLLQEVYFENRLYNSYLNELNTHNQYLKYLIETGFAGLVLFLFVLGWGVRRALLNRDPVFLSFMLQSVILCFSENMLDVNKGIFFFGFFFSFFMTGSKPEGRILRFTGKNQPDAPPLRSNHNIQ